MSLKKRNKFNIIKEICVIFLFSLIPFVLYTYFTNYHFDSNQPFLITSLAVLVMQLNMMGLFLSNDNFILNITYPFSVCGSLSTFVIYMKENFLNYHDCSLMSIIVFTFLMMLLVVVMFDSLIFVAYHKSKNKYS